MNQESEKLNKVRGGKPVRILWSHPVALWAFVFIFFRIFFLFANDGFIFDSEITDLAVGQQVFKEEFNNSTPARELILGNHKMLEGVTISASGVTGGEQYQIILLAGLMRVLGDSYYAVKIMPLAFSFLTFLFLLIAVATYLGKSAAHIFGPLFIAGFPSFTLQNYSGMGNHLEIALFWAIGFCCVCYLVFDENRRFSIPAFLLLGLTSGFGFFYNAISVSYLAWLAPVGLFAFFKIWKTVSGKIAVTGALVFFIGLLIGLSPYFPIRENLRVPLNIDLMRKADLSDYGGIGIDAQPEVALNYGMVFLETNSRTEFTAKGLTDVFWKVGKKIFLFKSEAADFTYYVMILLCFGFMVFSMWGHDKHAHYRLFTLLAFFLFFAHMLFLSASAQAVTFLNNANLKGYRYILPAIPFLFVWMSGALSSVINRYSRPVQILGGLVLLMVLGLGFYGNLEHFSPTKFLAYKDRQGFSYNVLAIGAGDYFREYPAELDTQCNMIRAYLSDCDPKYSQQVKEAVNDLCADNGFKLRNF